MTHAGPARTRELSGTIELPQSKSESNRVLVIKALCGTLTESTAAAGCDDSRLLKQALMAVCGSNRGEGVQTTDIGHGAAPARFLAAVMAGREGRSFILTGSNRLRERPFAPLTEALRELGADIHYRGAEGHLPLLINGRTLHGGQVETDAGVSSQFISALMLIGPTLCGGLEIRKRGTAVSRAYTRMTAEIMRRFGCEVQTGERRIVIKEGRYTDCDYTPEGDWSAASFWYSLMAAAGRGELTLKGLRQESIQPDSRAAEVFARLGVRTEYTAEGVRITPGKHCTDAMTMDCTDVPDMAMPLITACCAKGVKFRLSGLRTLALKESDRLSAMTEELHKFGFVLRQEGADVLTWDGERTPVREEMPTVKARNDHRVAMSMVTMGWERRFAIDDADVVTKSYPDFWRHISEHIHIAGMPKQRNEI